MAAKMPMTVDTNAATNAIIRVFLSAAMTVASEKSSRYQRQVKPPHTTLDLESFTDSTKSTAMGAYKKIKIRAI